MPRTGERATGLTRTQLAVVLVIALGLFARGAGPVWRDPWNIDAAVYLSYLAIPPLVAGLALATRRFSWPRLAVDSIGVAATKFAITYVAAVILWAFAGDPPRDAPTVAAPGVDASPAPTPRPPAEATVGDLVGTVTGPDHVPRPDVLVWLELDPRGAVWAPGPPVALTMGTGGLSPRAAAVTTWQRLEVASTDGRLHTLVGAGSDGPAIFNVAVPAGGRGGAMLTEPLGAVPVRCGVHASEPSGTLVVLPHPFATRSDAEGRFALHRVPEGPASVRVERLSVPVTVVAGRPTEVPVRIGVPL